MLTDQNISSVATFAAHQADPNSNSQPAFKFNDQVMATRSYEDYK